METLGSQLDNASLDTLKGGSGTINLNFENGELITQMKVDAPNNEMVYGKGNFSDGILKFAPADAILALGFALDLQKFVEIAEKEIIPEFGDDIKLNEPMPELGGLSIRDAIGAFKGEFLVSLTDVKMPVPVRWVESRRSSHGSAWWRRQPLWRSGHGGCHLPCPFQVGQAGSPRTTSRSMNPGA